MILAVRAVGTDGGHESVIVGRVGRRGQDTIAPEIRRRLNLQDGNRMAFLHHDWGIILQSPNKTLLDPRSTVPANGPQDSPIFRQRAIEAPVWKKLLAQQ